LSDTSLRFDFLKGRDTASPHMRRVADAAVAMNRKINLAALLSVAATTTMVAGFAALGAQGVALVSALAPLIGVLGLVPGLAVGAAGGIAALIIATRGLGAAMKQTGAGSGASAQAIAAAERRVENAQRSAAQAQRDLNDARLTAAERLASITRELNRAHLDERGAVLAVADAQRALRDARQSGDRSAIQHARLGYDEAVQSLEEVRARLADVTAEEGKRRKAGVEGSDEVQAALQRQADAVRELADAQAALKNAGGAGGVDKAAEAYARLSIAGQQLVDVLRGLGPHWRTVQRDVQQATFAGVGQDIRALAAVWLPMLRARLPQIGAGWNLAFRGSAQLATSTGFVRDMNVSLGNMAGFWQRVGRSFAPFESGFRHWTVVGSTFLPGIGDWVLRIGQRFDRWSQAARASGRAHAWIQNALVVLDQTWDVVKHLSSAIAGVFRAGSGGPDWMPGLVAGTKALSDWVNSPAGQGKLGDVFSRLRSVGSELWAVLTHLGPALLDLFSDDSVVSTMSVFGAVTKFAADNLDTLTKFMPVIIGAFILYKAAGVAAVVVDTIRIPLLIAQTASNFALAAAMRASQTATVTSTAATWGLNFAWLASPITWIILGIVALIAVIVLIATKTTWFQTIWDHVWSFLKMIGSWFGGPFADFFVRAWHNITESASDAWHWIVDKFMWLVTLPMRIGAGIAKAARGMWDGMVHGLKSALNWIISLINTATGKLNSFVIDNINRIPGVSIPHIPDIPYLAKGGDITRAGVAIVGENGPEPVLLPQGAQVRPNGSPIGGPTQVILRIDSAGAKLDDFIVHIIRKAVRARGGNVQKAFGTG